MSTILLHEAHIRREIGIELGFANAELPKQHQDNDSDIQKTVVALRVKALQAHRNGLTPINLDRVATLRVATLRETDQPQRFYGDWDAEPRQQWWLAKFNEDTFVNFLWPYSTVLFVMLTVGTTGVIRW
jgi:hypothetical protein